MFGQKITKSTIYLSIFFKFLSFYPGGVLHEHALGNVTSQKVKTSIRYKSYEKINRNGYCVLNASVVAVQAVNALACSVLLQMVETLDISHSKVQ